MTQVLKGWADADVAFVSFLFCNIISCKVSCAHALSRARVHLRQKWTGFSGAALLWQPVQEQPHSLTSLTERAWGETTSLGSLLLFLHLAPHRLHVLLSFLPSFKFSSLFFCSRYVFPLSLYSVYVVFFFCFFLTQLLLMWGCFTVYWTSVTLPFEISVIMSQSIEMFVLSRVNDMRNPGALE